MQANSHALGLQSHLSVAHQRQNALQGQHSLDRRACRPPPSHKCQGRVKDELLSPSSARFSGIFDTHVFKTKDEWRVVG